MERYRRLLQELANQCDGAAFWAILDDDRVFCLNTATANPKADPSLSAGSAPRFDETPISTALRARSSDFVLDPTSGLKSLLVDVRSHRGHELGSIGVVIRPDSPPRRRRRCAPQFKTVSRDAMTQDTSKPIGAVAPNPRPEPPRREASAFVRRRSNCRMLALAIIIAVALSLLSPYFLKTNNLLNLLDQSVVTGIVAIGMTFVILTGGIDLSVGSVVGLTGVILGLSLHHFSIPIAIALATLAGAGIGLFSGLLIAYFDLAAFVITLGVMAIGRSLAYIFSGQTSISDIPPQLNDLVYTEVFGIQTNVLTLLVLYALAWAYLTYTKGGRTIYAVGSNREAARTAGLNVLFYSVVPYVVSGALSAIAATLMSSQILSIDPLAGTGLELDAIAAVVIGGASLYGGRGTIIGTLIGVFIMVMIRNGLNLLGVSPFWQGSAIGAHHHRGRSRGAALEPANATLALTERKHCPSSPQTCR